MAGRIGFCMTRGISGLAASDNVSKVIYPRIRDDCRHAAVLLGIEILKRGVKSAIEK